MYLVDPTDVVKFDRDDHDLELFWLFCCVVAGKTAATQARLLDAFLMRYGAPGMRPFEVLRSIGPERMLDAVKDSRLGQFTRLAGMFNASVNLDLRNCGVDELEAVHGCGPKTARMFLMMSRPDQRYAALDTHVLKHLRANGIDAPKATPPSGARYRAFEQKFLDLVDVSGMGVAEYDLMVWKQYSSRS